MILCPKTCTNEVEYVILHRIIQHEHVRYMSTHDDACDFTRWVLSSFKVTNANYVTMTV